MENKDGSTKFNEAERRILDMLTKNKEFTFQGTKHVLEVCGKPKVEGGGGESKTDIYIRATRADTLKSQEIKISYKKSNFSFVENKITKKRAPMIYGPQWSEIIKTQIASIKDRFLESSLIYFKDDGKTGRGSIKLGWRYEMGFNDNRKLKARVSEDIARQVWYNKGASSKYVNAIVNGKAVPSSGMPNYFLKKEPTEVKSPMDVYENLIPVEEFITSHNEIDAVFLAQNYRTQRMKQEGNRDLAVWVDWSVVNGKIDGKVIFDDPLEMKSVPVFEKLKKSLEEIGVPLRKGFDIEMLKGKISSRTKTFG